MSFGCALCNALKPVEFNVIPYKGDCKHPNPDMGYGFRSAWHCHGLGAYFECEDCGAMEFHPDWEACTDKEKEWYKSSPWSQGWVIQENQNELQTNTLS